MDYLSFFLCVVRTPIATATMPMINKNSGHGLAVADPLLMPMSGIRVMFDPAVGVGVIVKMFPVSAGTVACSSGTIVGHGIVTSGSGAPGVAVGTGVDVGPGVTDGKAVGSGAGDGSGVGVTVGAGVGVGVAEGPGKIDGYFGKCGISPGMDGTAGTDGMAVDSITIFSAVTYRAMPASMVAARTLTVITIIATLFFMCPHLWPHRKAFDGILSHLCLITLLAVRHT